MRRRLLVAAIILAPLTLLPGPAAAHPGATAPEQYQRFLMDCSDDWGGHSAARDGHDLVALDVTERWIHEWDEGGLFVLLLVGFGYAQFGTQNPVLEDEIKLTFDQGAATVRLTTSDNQAFQAKTGSGLRTPDLLLPMRPSLQANGTQDGTRILLEFGFRYSSLGLAPGNVLKNVDVQAYAGNDRGDYMAGGYYLAGVRYDECPLSGSHGGQYRDIKYVRTAGYKLAGTDQPYLEWRIGTDTLAAAGEDAATTTIEIKNRFSKQPQILSLGVEGPAGWRFETSPGDTLEAGPSGTATWTLRAGPERPTNGTLTFTVTSDLGAHGTRDLPLLWFAKTLPPSLVPTSAAESPLPTLLVLALPVAAWMFHRRP